MADSVVRMRDQGIKSVTELDEIIKQSADRRQDIQDRIKEIEKEMEKLSATMEHAHTVKKYREIYKYHKANPKDTSFAEEYASELTIYKTAAKELLKEYDKMPDTKEILARLDKLHDDKAALMGEYSSSKNDMEDLFRIRKNFETYMEKKRERE